MMTATSRLVAILVGLLLSAVATLAANDSARVLGRWRSLETSRGGIGAMLEFRKEGILEYSPGAVVEMSYRVEGSQLVLPPGTEKGPEQRQTITWLGKDRLRLGSTDESAIELARKGSRGDSTSPIVGEWAGMQDMGGRKLDTLYFFYPGGKGLLLIRFLTQRGSYSFTNGKIRIAVPGSPSADATFKVDGEVLTLTTADSKTTRYARY
jgi:hypothetical protein